MPKTRSFKRVYNRYAPYVRTAARVGKALYRGYTASRRYPKRATGGGVTAQYDKTVQYRYRRLPRAKRRSAKRFNSRVNYVLDKQLATQTVLRNSSLSGTWVDGVQQTFAVCAYGWNGTDDTLNGGMSDMRTIMASVFPSQENGKVRFMNCHVDCTFQNTGSTNTEVDVYEFYWRANEIYSSVTGAWDDAAAETPTIGIVGASALTRNSRGATPFEFPMLCRQLKIVKKTKHLVPVGQAFTVQMRERRNRVVTVNDVNEYGSFGCKGWTKGMVFVCKSTVGDVDGDGSCKIGVTRTYRFSQLRDSNYGDAILT